ncbi:MAG: hypothetical protein RIQ33_1559 [Bacteroidota bacterium]|jgi:hypothetical protein
MNNIILIEPQYLPPISFFKMIKNAEGLQFELHEHYVKSSYRNRCYLPGPNGVLLLSIPLHSGKVQQHTAMKNVKICYTDDWQKEHWKSISFLYRSAPYFEYYEDDFKEIFDTKFEKLADLNIELLKLMLKKLNFTIPITFTNEYLPKYENLRDERNKLKPNVPLKNITDLPIYQQVFEDKIGFKPNMSMLDLLFSEGNNAFDLL